MNTIDAYIKSLFGDIRKIKQKRAELDAAQKKTQQKVTEIRSFKQQSPDLVLYERDGLLYTPDYSLATDHVILDNFYLQIFFKPEDFYQRIFCLDEPNEQFHRLIIKERENIYGKGMTSYGTQTSYPATLAETIEFFAEKELPSGILKKVVSKLKKIRAANPSGYKSHSREYFYDG